MAVDKATSVSRRRVVYGANAAIQSILVLLVVVGAVYLAQRYKRQADLTRTGVNSLSPRTAKLLRNLPQDVTITGLYTVLSKYDERAQKRQDTVRDLLALYESAGHGKVTANLIDPMKDRTRLPALLKRLREKPAYRDQAKAHEQVLNGFPPLNQEILALIEEQTREAGRLLESEPALKNSVVMEVMQELGRLRRRTEDVNREVQGLQTDEIPQYGRAAEQVRKHVEAAAGYFRAVGDFVKNKAPLDRNLAPAALEFLQRCVEAYQPLLTRLDEFVKSAHDLKPVELEALSEQLSRWAAAPPILIETPEKAQIVPFAEVWPFRTDRTTAPDGDDRDFAGEQAISSAILKMTQKEKTAVVFTRYGGPSPIVPDFSQMNMMNMRQLPRAPYGVLNELLTKENFVTQDWDVSAQKTPPVVEDAARTVHVVFPPEPPAQPDPRRPAPQPGISPQDVQTVLDAVEKSGMAIFLTGWRPPTSPFPAADESKYEYAEYLSSKWGIDVESKYLVLPFAPSSEDPRLYIPIPQTRAAIIDTPALQFSNHPIVGPLHASVAGLDASCPLRVLGRDKLPAGVTAEPLLSVKPTKDIWALADVSRLNSDFRTQRGTYRRDEDIAPPFAVAVAAERTAEPAAQPSTAPAKAARLVVFGSATFVGNPMLEMPGGFLLTGGGLQAYAAYPANPDLFINALHWLTDDADRISVGARRSEVPRLDRLKDDAWLAFWRVFLVGIWPGLALAVGGGVWLFRRR